MQWDRVVADCLAEATSELTAGRRPEPVLARHVGGALRADYWMWGWAEPGRGRATLEVWPDPPDEELMRWAAVARPRSHPVLNHWLDGHTDTVMVSTLVDDARAWRGSEGYSLLRRGFGLTETGGVRLDSGTGSLHVIGVARESDLTPQDVGRLAVLRPAMVALVLHAEWLRARRSARDWAVVAPALPEQGLTTRELQVLELLADGLLAASIARRLRVSVRTVHCHLAHIYAKLGEHDRLSAVRRAQQAGLLAPADEVRY
ncbi:helix-turn-helix transcriptional regulator [Georgenia phoenicis]|uniref:helix-turn-helix transcriptional regulator n=1 Tax=unclassified Georgenia TaxID=2626815 RepID=UPI0039AF733F